MKLTISKVFGEIVALMTYCATANMEYLSSNKCADRFKNILEIITEYKNIEEELGINLITLFKALKNGIYVKDLKGKIHFVKPHLRMVTNTHLGLEFQCPIKWRYIQLPEDAKDYGKTWTLTKEELENE